MHFRISSSTPVALLIALLGALGASNAYAQALVSPAVSDEASRGSVRVLVRLQTAIVPEARLAGPSAVADQRQRIAAAQDRVSQSLGPSARVRKFRSIPWIATEITRSQLAALTRHPAVAAITRDELMRPAAAQSAAFIGAPTFWQVGYRGEGWTVAVLDTGVDATHPVLAGRVVHEACFSTTSETEGATSLCAGGAPSAIGSGTAHPCAAGIAGCDHGTAIAGVIAGASTQADGVAPRTRLMSIQVYSRINSPALCGSLPTPCALSFTSDQIAGLEHVLDMAGPANAAHIAAANLSLSGKLSTTTCDTAEGMPAFKEAVDNLRAIDIPTIVAAGNQGYVDRIGQPSCVSSAVSVGAIAADLNTGDDIDVLSGGSNRASFLSLLAPGERIESASPGGGFNRFDGTSLSAAFVSGGWALLKQFMPDVTVTAMLDALKTTGVPVPDAPINGTNPLYPRIRLVDGALAANGSMPVSPGLPGDPAVLVSGNNVTFSWTPPTTGNGVTRYIVSAGSQPGASDVAIYDVGFATSISAIAGTGTYFARVLADNPGGFGPATADVMFTVDPPMPPGAPLTLTSQVVGQTVTLTWQTAASGGAATSYVVEAGDAEGRANVAIFDTNSAELGVVVNGVPPGVYYVRVRAKNPVSLSNVSNEIIVTVH